MLLSKEILLIPKITPQNAKNALQFLNIYKKHFCLQQGKSLTTLSIFIVKGISGNNSNAVNLVTVRHKFKKMKTCFPENRICCLLKFLFWAKFFSRVNILLDKIFVTYEKFSLFV